MFLTGEAVHPHSRPRLQRMATEKWYRADYFEDLTGRARGEEGDKGAPDRVGAATKAKRLRLRRRRFEKSEKRSARYGLAAGG